MRKFVKISLLLLVMLLASSVAFADWRGRVLYNHMLSGGLQFAQRLTYGYTGPDGVSTEWKADASQAINQLYGFNFRIFPFMRGRLGIGLEGFLLDYFNERSETTTEYVGYDSYGYYQYIYTTGWTTEYYKWLMDLDVLYRLPLSPTLLVNGGAGITYELVQVHAVPDNPSLATVDESFTGNFGFNLKVGGELLLGGGLSATIDWKWQTWASGVGKEQFTIFTVIAGVHMWF